MAKAQPNEKVDVLIIGAGASGAAVAWSLAETKMHIVCLEQGDWINPRTTRAPGATGNAEHVRLSRISPNVRQPAPTTRSTTTTRRSRSSISTAWAAAPSCTRRTSRAFTRPTSRCARSMVSPTIGRSTIAPRAVLRAERSHHRCFRAGRRSGIPRHQPPLPPVPLGLMGETVARAFNRWAGTGGHPTARSSRGPTRDASAASIWAAAFPAARKAPRAAPTSPTGRCASRAGVELRTRCRVREITSTTTVWRTASSTTTKTASSRPARGGRDRRLQRRRHAAAVAEFDSARFPTGSQPIRAWSART